MERRLISVREACVILGVGRTKFYSLCNANALTTLKLGSRRLVAEESVYAFIDNLIGDGKQPKFVSTERALESRKSAKGSSRKNRAKKFRPEGSHPSETNRSGLSNTDRSYGVHKSPSQDPTRPEYYLNIDSKGGA